MPIENSQEASVVDLLFLLDTDDFLSKTESIESVKNNIYDLIRNKYHQYELDFSYVQGQENVKYALEIAAAGGHNLIIAVPPGIGKIMQAKRISTILLPFILNEALETT